MNLLEEHKKQIDLTNIRQFTHGVKKHPMNVVFTPQIGRELTRDIIPFAPKGNFKLPARPVTESFSTIPEQVFHAILQVSEHLGWCHLFVAACDFPDEKQNLKDSENRTEHQPPVQRINSPSMVTWCESLASNTYNRSGSSILLRSRIIWCTSGWCRPLFLDGSLLASTSSSGKFWSDASAKR